jgi:hypothetical protein
MSKVRPYIITVKYIGVYSDPKPTEEQILAELNVDPISMTIEEAELTVRSAPPVAEAEAVTSEPVSQVRLLRGRPPGTYTSPRTTAKLDTIKRNLLPFDTTDLEANGPSVKILSALYEKPRTQRELRELTKLNTPAVATTLCRLKKKGRVVIAGTSSMDGSVYSFVR